MTGMIGYSRIIHQYIGVAVRLSTDLKVRRARDIEVGHIAMHVGENVVALLGDSVETNDGDDLLWRLLCWRLAGGRVNRDRLSRSHVDVYPLLSVQK